MSDVMMFGIAQMPYEMAMDDEISRRQFYANTQRLVAALEAAREDARAVYAKIPQLPVTPETCAQATDAFTAFYAQHDGRRG